MCTGVKLVGETFLTPGSSLLLDGNIGGISHQIGGLWANSILGPIGLLLVSANSYTRSTTGKSLMDDRGLYSINHGQSAADAAAGGRGDDEEFSYGSYDWVENDDGTFDVSMPVSHFETYTLVDIVIDTDNNGIHDFWDGAEDTDSDGTWNAGDWDNDGDRVADEVEMFWDDDGDGVYAFLDTDSDGDGVLDGMPTCANGADCACGFRVDQARKLCVEGDDVICHDGDFGFGAAEFEIVPGVCPEPETGMGATCTDVGDVVMHLYDTASSAAGVVFCNECVSGLAPANFCD